MNYDLTVPLSLKKEQIWFGSILKCPIDQDSRINPIAPSGQTMEVEVAKHIKPSHTLRPIQRMQIYNQQYWWRLLNCLHNTFPLVTRLFGYFDFNRIIGIPYLIKYPPHHWSLNVLGDHLARWIQDEYHAGNKNLILDAVKIDWVFNYCFSVEDLSPLSQKEVSEEKALDNFMCETLYLQPYVQLFQMEHDLFSFRLEILKEEPDYWLENPLPLLQRTKTYFFVFYRNKKNDLCWKEISSGEYHLLNFFQKGASLEWISEWLENQTSELFNLENLQAWFQEWVQRGWLVSKTSLRLLDEECISKISDC